MGGAVGSTRVRGASACPSNCQVTAESESVTEAASAGTIVKGTKSKETWLNSDDRRLIAAEGISP